MKTNKSPNVRTKVLKILPANRFASRKQIYKIFRTSDISKEIFLESESFTSEEELKSERCWLLRMVIYWCDCSQCLVDHYFVEFHRNPKVAVCSTSLKAFPSPMETERGNFLLFVAALRIKETTATLPRLNLQGTECKNSHSQWREELPPWLPSDNSERSSTQQHKSAGRSRAWAPSLTRIWAVTKWI